VALVDNNQLDCDVSGTTCTLATVPWSAIFEGPDEGLCAGEPFAEQPTGPFCTGFLIAPDLVATAGHCITEEWQCPFTAFVFGFAIGTLGGEANTSGLETYRCSAVVESVARYAFESDGTFQDAADYAVVRLDRPVPNRAPLVLRRDPRVAVGDRLVVIGHPFGLPLKVADGGEVRSIAGTFFQANLDISGGNSGSPVLDGNSLEVAGILVRGPFDDMAFDQEQRCWRSARYTDAEGQFQLFAQATQAVTLPLVDSCLETMTCPQTTAVATCAFSEKLPGHSSRCQECSSEPRPVRAVRRRIDRSQRLLARGFFSSLRKVRKATQQLERASSELDRLSDDGRVSDQCVGALQSVIDETLGIAQYGLEMLES
jgi:V8-like Glu-specific endopeptidase